MECGRRRRQTHLWFTHLLITLVLLLTPCSTEQDSARRPRPRNGLRESTREEAITRLSRVFDIDRVPQHAHHNSPPEYMVEFFQQVAYEDGISRAPGPYQADVVRGYPDRAAAHQMVFIFNISYFSEEEEIRGAEFHLFKIRPSPSVLREENGDTSASGRRRRAMTAHFVDLRLYQIVDEETMYSEEGVQLIEQRRISVHQHGWQVFRVGDTVKQWANDSSTNMGFVLTATSPDGTPVNGTLVRFAQRHEHHDSKQPGLVIFTENTRTRVPLDQDLLPVRDRGLESMRESFIQHMNEEYRAKNGPPPYRSMHNYMSAQMHSMLTSRTRSRRSKRSATSTTFPRYSRRRRRMCQQAELFVDFNDIGWADWIISPKGYNAFHCKGTCSFPLVQNLKPTNHATVQSIVHALKLPNYREVETPCCVPNKLYSISLLYFDDEENVILKQYDNMVAATCGCH